MPERLPPTAWVRLGVTLAIGAVVGVLVAVFGPAGIAPLVAWDATALSYVVWAWRTEGVLDAARTRAHAVREDPGRAATDGLLLVASVASLGGVAAVIAGTHTGVSQVTGAAIGLLSVALSWALVHTVYTARYARVFYNTGSGVDFNENTAPSYRDFAYLAFTIGMTYQVSDTDLTSKTVRAAALRHALLSYVLGAVILAATINLIAGLAR